MLQSSSWRGGLLGPGGVSLVPGGSPWSWGGLLGPGGVSLVWGGGLFGPGGSPWSGGVLLGPGGGSPWSRGGLPGPGGALRRPPPVDRITDTCKNITLATTSLRPVKI